MLVVYINIRPVDRHDDFLDLVFSQEHAKYLVSFWCDLKNNYKQYKDISLLSLLIITLHLTVVDVKDFSVLIHVRNGLQSRMSYNTLNAWMVLGLEER